MSVGESVWERVRVCVRVTGIRVLKSASESVRLRALVKVRLRVRVGVLVKITTGRVCGRALKNACGGA